MCCLVWRWYNILFTNTILTIDRHRQCTPRSTGSRRTPAGSLKKKVLRYLSKLWRARHIPAISELSRFFFTSSFRVLFPFSTRGYFVLVSSRFLLVQAAFSLTLIFRFSFSCVLYILDAIASSLIITLWRSTNLQPRFNPLPSMAPCIGSCPSLSYSCPVHCWFFLSPYQAAVARALWTERRAQKNIYSFSGRVLFTESAFTVRERRRDTARQRPYR